MSYIMSVLLILFVHPAVHANSKAAFQKFSSDCGANREQFYKSLVQLDTDLFAYYSKKSQLALKQDLFGEKKSDDAVRYFVPYLITDRKVSKPFLNCWARLNNAILFSEVKDYTEADSALKEWEACQSSAFAAGIPHLPSIVLNCFQKISNK